MYLDYILSFQVFVTFISWVCGNSLEDLKVEYYENLITQGIRDAAKYKVRTDNSDFFQNVTGEGVINYGKFDFIIVGAGTAGSALAARLSEIHSWKILLLEAGKEENDLNEIPGLHTLNANVYKNWGYFTTVQKNGCLGMINQQCSYTRGLSVGGTSAVSGLIYTRGNRKDYDSWGQLGNKGWFFKDVLPYFKKSERTVSFSKNNYYHGFDGPINNEFSLPNSKYYQVYVDAIKEFGYGEIDFNGKNQIGIGKIQYNTLYGKRVSGGSGYLKTAIRRSNFYFKTKALVTKILFEKENNAKGVLFICNKKLYRAEATKEVILSAGAVNTPQILMVSGVGPRKELEKHNIRMRVDSPVGEYFKDQVGYLSVFVRTNSTVNQPEVKQVVKEYFKGIGLLTKTLNTNTLSFINTQNRSSKVPDIELAFVDPPGTTLGMQSTKHATEEILNSFNRKFNVSTDIAIAVTLLHPKSIGKISLKSNSIKDFPNIDINIFSEREDVDNLYNGIKLVLRLIESDAFKKLNASVYSNPEPCKKYEFLSDEFWFCCIKHISFAAHNLVGTTKMGPKSDRSAVVDEKFRVYGTANLRVVDCGVIPVTISGHLNGPAYMLGEKAADVIKGDYNETEDCDFNLNDESESNKTEL